MENIKTMPEGTLDQLDKLVIKKRLSEEPGRKMPLVISPEKAGVELVDWMTNNKESFEKDLVNYGGILLRGFPVTTVEDFNQFMKCFNTEPLPYMFRSSPREELDKKIKNIYMSTSYPNERSINMHNESSYSRVWGMKIIFCCIQPAEEGGETPLADCRNVLRDINPLLADKFRKKGVKYRRNLFPGLGMPWQEVFQTDDRKVVEVICKKNDIDFAFTGQDLVIEWVKPAIYHHPVTREETWFNHVFFFNKYSRYEELDMAPDDFLPPEYLSSETFFGDGSVISYDEYLEIKTAFEKNLVVFPYQKGDIIFLDNMLTAHGRRPYKGKRTIATAIIEAASDASYVL